MKPFFVFLLISIVGLKAFSQNQKLINRYISFSAGRVLFGTGDVAGFSINIEGSKNIIKAPKKLLSRLLVGAEFSFENGVKNPVIENPTDQEFIRISFQQISNSILTGKISYFPFNSLFNGFNISLGASAGYSFHSFEKSARRFNISPTESERQSTLTFDNRFIIGYRISTGYDFKLSPHIFSRIRLDFANYTNGDINTLAGAGIGYIF
ncbi:MAG TPA: hypothetical protein VIQ00_01530 [Chitinophagaceae bacterium]